MSGRQDLEDHQLWEPRARFVLLLAAVLGGVAWLSVSWERANSNKPGPSRRLAVDFGTVDSRVLGSLARDGPRPSQCGDRGQEETEIRVGSGH